MPRYLVTDQGAEFESKELARFLSYMGIVRKRTTAYHPQANGIIERMHATLKASLRCIIDKGGHWVKALPLCLLGLRTAISDWGVSPSLVLYGEQISIPGMVVHHVENIPGTTPAELVDQLQQESAIMREVILANDKTLGGTNNDAPPRIPKFPTDYVLIKEMMDKPSLHPRYRGPYKIIRQEGPNLIILRAGKEECLSMDRCRPYYTLNYDKLEINRGVTDVDNRVMMEEVTQQGDNTTKSTAIDLNQTSKELPIKPCSVSLDRLPESRTVAEIISSLL